MQDFNEQLSYITNTLKLLTSKDLNNINDIKHLGYIIKVSDKISGLLTNHLNQIEQLSLKATAKLASKIDDMKPILVQMEEKFKIKYSKVTNENIPPVFEEKKQILVNIGSSIVIPSTLYVVKELIPIMQYGTVLQDGTPIMLFNYGNGHFVSITSSQIIEYGGHIDNYHTICCANPRVCEFKNHCKFFHDPLLCPDSQHTQRFMKTPLVKKAPNFGNANSFIEHLHTLNFDNLRTLGRYCSYMNLLIGQIAASESKIS